MSEKLKPCPFCGGEAEYSKINTSNTVPFGTVQHFVTCKKNCLEGLYARGNTKEEAIKEWNTRPNPWHTGTPTEEGWYVCKMKGIDLYETQYFTGVNWNEEIIEKWQKIEEERE